MPNLAQAFIHLGPTATAIPQPPFTDSACYEAYGARHGSNGLDGQLVTQWEFTADWDSWEMHPHGEEVVICTAGAITLHQQFADGSTASVTLLPGDYAINPRGCWHTTNVSGNATAVFITPGLGPEGRPR